MTDGIGIATPPNPTTPGLQRVLSPYATFEAMQFDGSRESAIALSRAFKDRVAMSVEHDDVLLVHAVDALDREGLHVMAPGSWLVGDRCFYGSPRMLTDQHFRCVFTPFPGNA